jgi:NAD(P)-dependent dehydrogenase (short-subunit alcohol dehydrogenase family)
MTRLEQVGCHGATHGAEPDETHLHAIISLSSADVTKLTASKRYAILGRSMRRRRLRSRPHSGNFLFTGGVILGAIASLRAAKRKRRRLDFRDKVAVVTGGSRGLGLVLARELVAEGAQVAICARDEAELARARAELQRATDHVLAIPCDLTQRDQVEAMLAKVRERLGPVDVLINNAGAIQVGPMDEMTTADYEEALRVHFWAPLFTTLGVLPDMRRRHMGRIVNVASIGGKISVSHLLPYSTSKFALVGFSEGLRAAVARDHVYVTTVCPGLMRTGSPRNAWFKGRHRQEFAWFSIGDSLPLLTMAATHAARRILDACRYGDAELVMPFSTAAAVKLHALFPNVAADILSLADRLLPEPGGIGTAMRRGAESESRWSPSPLTILNEKAAASNNEIRP